MSIQRPKTQRIIALSDLHADLEAFIVCLRDCACVIKKRDSYGFSQNQPDKDLYTLLNIKSIHDDAYAKDLHYDWIGEDTIVVIVGDLIDGARESDSVTKETDVEICYYPQVEVKLLHFINALNKQVKAQGHNGGIIKVLGNHDYENFKGNQDMIGSYAFTPDRENEFYYQHEDGTWESRRTFFQFGHEGYRLYQQTLGMYIIFCINDLIFVHGQLPLKQFLDREASLMTFDTIHKLLDSPYTSDIKKELEKYDDLITSVLWERSYGDTSERDNSDREEFMRNVSHDITKFCGSMCGPDPAQHVKLFIGHCQQHLVHQDPEERSTLGYLCKRTRYKEIYSNKEMYHGLPDGKEDNINKTFGIVTEGLLPKRENLFQPQIIKLDVGVGRGQEYKEDYDALQSGQLSEFDFFRPRAPQVIEVIDTKLQIHRSSMENMAKHMKRDTYRGLDKSYPSIYPKEIAPPKRKTKRTKIVINLDNQ